MGEILLGYEVGTAEPVYIKPSHIIVTGITQLSGKTTTIEALIKRSKLRAVVFKTKPGEKGFSEGTEIPPFFRDRSDYEFVKSLIEAYAKEKLFLERGTLMKLCKGSASLIEIKRRVDDEIAGKTLKGLKEEIYTRLQHYLENLIPQIQYANLSKVLTVYDGINIMNLERFSEEAQSLIIQSVTDEVLKTMKDVIIVMPEAWKFLPQKYNNPCKRAVISFIRQGATNNNFIWIDSQDMAGVDKEPLKQISTWILGYQAERNEVKHTLDQISLPKKMKPAEDEIMTLKIGHFFLSSYDGVKKIYVQPGWLPAEDAIRIAKGDKSVDEISKPDSLVPFSIAPSEKKGVEIRYDDSKIRRELIEMRGDFFNKAQELQAAINKAYTEIYNLSNKKQEVNIDEIVSKVLQKMPMNHATGAPVNEEEIISKVLARVPASSGAVYEIAPLEKIKKNFLNDAKNRILKEVSELTLREQKILLFTETQNKGVNVTQVLDKALHLSPTGGSNRQDVLDAFKKFDGMGIARYDKSHGLCYAGLKTRISSLLSDHGAEQKDIDQVYDHILVELSK